MSKPVVKIRSIEKLTHDVLKIVTERPPNYTFSPGQATELCINKEGWQNETRPFTFTCLPDSDYLEFTIKTYPTHKGVTNELLHLKVNDEFILGEIFGEISYKGEGTFIAGGAGITPFIAIFRHLKSQNKVGDNRLIFANKTKGDIILETEFRELLGTNFINILSDENVSNYAHGMISEQFLKSTISDLTKRLYLCGPEPMMEAVEQQLARLGVDKEIIVKEVF